MKKPILCTPLVLTALLLAPWGPASSAEIPSDPGQAVAAAPLERSGTTRELDATELRELAQSDPARKGGDAIVTVAVIAAIVMLIYILMEHMHTLEHGK